VQEETNNFARSKGSDGEGYAVGRPASTYLKAKKHVLGKTIFSNGTSLLS
jgi:hypothetical protein